jgi:hypothetical protein
LIGCERFIVLDQQNVAKANVTRSGPAAQIVSSYGGHNAAAGPIWLPCNGGGEGLYFHGVPEAINVMLAKA